MCLDARRIVIAPRTAGQGYYVRCRECGREGEVGQSKERNFGGFRRENVIKRVGAGFAAGGGEKLLFEGCSVCGNFEGAGGVSQISFYYVLYDILGFRK